MPRVPQQQVSDAPLPGVRVGGFSTPDSYGAGVGKTLARIGASLYEREVDAADHAAVLEAETQAGAAQLQTLNNLNKYKGKQASLAVDESLSAYDDATSKIRSGLSDRQRGIFDTRNVHRREAVNRAALSYSNAENDRFQEQNFKANIEQSINLARANAQFPKQVMDELINQDRTIREYGAIRGFSPEQTDLAVTQAHSQTNTAVINALLASGNDIQAKAYYDFRKKAENGTSAQFTAEHRDAIERALGEGSTRGEARRTAEALIQKHGLDTLDQRKALLDDIRGIDNDKVADLVRQRVEHEFSTVDQFRKAQADQNFLNASKMIDETWKTTTLPVRELIPPALWQSMTPAEQHTLELKAERLRAPVITHDAEAWFRFKTMPDEALARLTPAKLMGEYLNKFDKEHYDRALNEYNAAINIKAKKDSKPSDEKFVSALTTRERIKNAFNLSGVAKDPKKLTSEESIWFDRFETAADKALSILPKDASPEQIDKVLSGISDSLLKQKYTVDPGAFRFNKTVPAIGLPDQQEPRSIRVPLKDIPPDRQDALKGALRQAGVPITNQAIEELEAKSRLKKVQ